jgi:putative ABC transport system permease protein
VGSQSGVRLRVGSIYQASQMLGGEAILPDSLYQKAVPAAERGVFTAYVKLRSPNDLVPARAALVAAVKPYLVVSVQDSTEFSGSVAKQVNNLLLMLWALLGLSLVIAILGIVNTLALSIFERTREIGLLRAVGLSRFKMSMVITLESVSTALFGTLIGAGAGLALGVALRQALRTNGLGVLSIPWPLMAAFLLAAVVAGVVASVLPAIRAARMDVLSAISTS